MVINTPGFQDALEDIGLKEALVKQGITPQKIASKINLLLDAKAGKKNDYGSIDKGLKHATAIYGVMSEPPKPTNTTYNFVFSADVQGSVKEFEEKIKSRLIQSETQNESDTKKD